MLIFLAFLAIILAAGILFQILAEAIDARRFPPPGRCIQLATGPKLQIYSQPNANPHAPNVIFEAGISGSSLGWATVQPLVAQFANAVVYDRAGLGWSSGVLTPRTVTTMVEELSTLLQLANIPPPYFLVGHSFGCLLIQAFAHAHPAKTTALVLVDPVTQIGWANATDRDLFRLQTGARLARRGAVLARIGIVRFALTLLISGGKLIPQLIARASSGPGDTAIARLVGEVRKLPPQTHPIIASHWSRSRAFTALAAYLDCLPVCARTALSMPIPPQIPLVILSAASATPSEIAERNAWQSANLHAIHNQVEGTGHWLQLERPQLVADAIRNLAT